MLSAGIGTIGSVLTYRDAHAPLEIADPKPVFWIVGGPPSHRDLVLLRMEGKKDHCELQYSKNEPLFGPQMGIPG